MTCICSLNVTHAGLLPCELCRAETPRVPWPIEVDLSRQPSDRARKPRTRSSGVRVRSRNAPRPCSNCGRLIKGMKACDRRCRFEAFVIPEPNSGCELWIGNCHERGYGLFRDGKTRKATHVALELDGRAAPKHERGEVCMHLCDTPACVNPRHLRVGSTLENVMDRDSKERLCRGSRCHRSRLSEADVRAVLESSESDTELGRRFGVAPQSIYAIRTGRSWKHIPRTPQRGRAERASQPSPNDDAERAERRRRADEGRECVPEPYGSVVGEWDVPPVHEPEKPGTVRHTTVGGVGCVGRLRRA